MTPNEQPLNERVAVLEISVEDLKKAVNSMMDKEDRNTSLLNTICVNVATLTQRVETIVSERSVWKNPLVWTNLISLGVAITILLKS